MEYSSPYLIVGKGKVGSSLARYLKNALAVEETESETCLYKWVSAESQWQKLESFPGNLDSFPWQEISFENVFLSPGVDPRRSFFSTDLQRKERRELDLFCGNFKGKILAITGTNGKSTACFQTGYLAQKYFGEQNVFVGGNLGTPMMDLFLEKPQAKIAVLEVSSYQAERLASAHLDIGVLLNLAPDHLDRYESEQDYYQAKWNLISRSKIKVFPREYKSLSCLSSDIDFSVSDPISDLLYSIYKKIEKQRLWPSFISKLKEEDFSSLPRLPHRLEWIPQLKRKVINDSKATNVNSVIYALRQSPAVGKRRIILGGIHKGDDFSLLKSELGANDEIWIYGKDRELISNQLHGIPQKLQIVSQLKDLFPSIFENLEEEDLVLLSPGCASFDEFKNYEDRGNQFREAAKKVLL